MLTIGREGKRKGFETETQETIEREGKRQGFEKEIQEVLSAIGSAYCSLKRLGKHHKKCLRITHYRDY